MGILEKIGRGYPAAKRVEQSYAPAVATKRRIRQQIKRLAFVSCALLVALIIVTFRVSVNGREVRWHHKDVGETQSRTDLKPGLSFVSGGGGKEDQLYDKFSIDEDANNEHNLDGPRNSEYDADEEDEHDNAGYDGHDPEEEDYDSTGFDNHDSTGDYREIFSITTRNRKFFFLYFEGAGVTNPNIIPHPTKHDMWIVVARREESLLNPASQEQLTCSAGFLDDVLVCSELFTVLPVEASINGQCEDDYSYFNNRFGPRDARLFYGSDVPFVIYGSQSQYTCMGNWLQDARGLLEPFRVERFTLSNLYQNATELERPKPWKAIEKNFFIFWDNEGKIYAHYDVWPKRVFAQLGIDGTVGENLAPLAANKDTVCMAQYMPSVAPEFQHLYQATNSLKITLCKRSDTRCVPGNSNTFIMHLIHHKSVFDDHPVHEPYVLLFQQAAPFAIHAIGQRPFWIHGRGKLDKASLSMKYYNKPESMIPQGHTERFYITSMSWKTHGLKYHGYLDDPLILAFGIEDSYAGGVDVFAGDLLQDLAFC